MREHRVDPARPREPIVLTEETVPAESPPAWTPLGGRQDSTGKFAAGLRGLKHAIRGNSSFFAHAYRGTLIALSAALLGVDALGWCFLVIGATFVLIAEITYSAVDALARACGDPEEPPLKTAREIATAGPVVAAFASGGITITVLLVKFGEMFGWWGR
jgi:diacylglycerol kinase